MFYTSRLLLRAFDPRCDTHHWTQWLNTQASAQTIRMDGLRPTAAADVKTTVEKLAKGGDVLPCFAICLLPSAADEHPSKLQPHEDLFVKGDGSARYPMIGALNLRGSPTAVVSPVLRTVSLGILFDEQYQGMGYGPEVLRWVFGYLFDTLGLHRLEIQMLASNVHAEKAYAKAGFVEEGRLRKAAWVQGEWVDVVWLAVLEEDWQRMKGKE